MSESDGIGPFHARLLRLEGRWVSLWCRSHLYYEGWLTGLEDEGETVHLVTAWKGDVYLRTREVEAVVLNPGSGES